MSWNYAAPIPAMPGRSECHSWKRGGTPGTNGCATGGRPPIHLSGGGSAAENSRSGIGFILYKPGRIGVYFQRTDVSEEVEPSWCERIYEAKAAELILYGRALGLSHDEAEDVLQETFAALLQRGQPPTRPEHYCVRSFRNRAFNYRRGLWRRLTRELEDLRKVQPA